MTTVVDPFKDAFNAYEASRGTNAVSPHDLRNAFAECGLIVSPIDFQDLWLPRILTVVGKGSLSYRQFVDFARKVGSGGLERRNSTGMSDIDDLVARRNRAKLRKESNLLRGACNDQRSENSRKLDALRDIRERLADMMSSVAQGASLDTNSLETRQREVIQDAVVELESLGYTFVPVAALDATRAGADPAAPPVPAPATPQSPPSSELYTAPAVVNFIDQIAADLADAISNEVEFVEAYSADDITVDSKNLVIGRVLDTDEKMVEFDAAKHQLALRELEEYTFSSDSAFAKQGSAAFRQRTKDFPFFMFPIDSVCARLDALDALEEQYANAIAGHEFLLIPKCAEGRQCRLQDVPEHRLKVSHPCFSDVTPCPHRYRPLHMRCYSHPEDDNPDKEQKIKNLQKRLGILDLSGMEIGDAGAQCLAYVLQRDRQRQRPMYQELLIGGNHLSPGGAVVLLEYCANLVHVDLSGNNLGYKTVALVQASAIGPALQSLITRSDKLVTLNLSRNRLSDRDGRYITEGLKTNSTLRSLDLRKNELGMTFGADMAAALADNRDLRDLFVGWNRLESVGSMTLLAEMKTSSTLEEVDLSWTGISDDGAKALAEMIAGSMSLKHLSISQNNIGPDGAAAISKALVSNKSLQYLDMSFNPLGTKAANDFVKDLKDNVTLEHLDLRCVKAGDEVLNEIKRIVKLREPRMQQAGLKMTLLFSTSVVGGAPKV